MLDKCNEQSNLVGEIYGAVRSTYMNCENVAFAMYRAVQNAGESHFHHANTPADHAVCYYDEANENAHVHKLLSDGRMGRVDCRYEWTSGWTVATSYGHFGPAAANNYLLMLKTGTGKIHLHSPATDGAVGARFSELDWSSGWSTVKGFTLSGADYLFFLKYSDGSVKINLVKADGDIGQGVYSSDWSKGWSIAEFYEVDGVLYLLLIKGTPLHLGLPLQYTLKGDGSAKIFRVSPRRVSSGAVNCPPFGALPAGIPDSCVISAPVFSLVREYEMAEGWSFAKPFTVANAANDQKYLFRLKAHDGTKRINKFRSDGTIGEEISNAIWTDGWTTAEFFDVGTQSFLYLMKQKDGRVKIYKLRSDGQIGDLASEYDWRSGWTTATFYDVGGEPYVLLQKANKGGIDTIHYSHPIF